MQPISKKSFFEEKKQVSKSIKRLLQRQGRLSVTKISMLYR